MGKPFEAIANRLRQAREALELTQVEFAQRAGLTAKQYNNWESGRYRIGLDGALALRKTYGVSLDFIYEGNVAALPNKIASALRSRPRDSHSR